MSSPFRGVRPRAFSLFVLGAMAACSPVGGPLPPSPDPGPTVSRAPERPPAPRPRVAASWAPPTSARLALNRLPPEVRALWVVRTTLTHPDSIRAMVDRAYRAGFNTLIVQIITSSF